MSTASETTPGLCIDCNYPLHDLDSPRCPECGRPFDPADVRTMNMGRPIGTITRFALRPTRWVWPAAVIAMFGTLLFCNWTTANVPYSLGLLCAALMIVLLAIMPKLAFRAWAIRHYRLSPHYKALDDAAARSITYAFGIAAAAMALCLPLILVLIVNLPSLHPVATHEYANVPFYSPRARDVWIGLLPVREVKADATGVTFVLRGGVRLHHLPNPSRDMHHHRRWLFGDWYVND